ncbi:hypothetical protein ASG03_03380 [Rhizobium sp. Leaf341]|nr:hypothetical protein ASG03_03380 [Rhizobium sp. Leaf341]
MERVGSQVVEDPQLDPGELVDQARKAATEPGKAEAFERTRHTQVNDGMIQPGSLATEGAGKPSFTRSGLARDDHVLMCL